MAIPWITLIRSVPWQQVAKKAPEIAELAKKLWNTTYSKNPPTETYDSTNGDSANSSTANQTGFISENARMNAVEEKLAVVEANSSRLHKQLRESIELVTELAEQNAQLIKAIEINRKRILTLAVLTTVIGVVAVCALFFALR